MAWPAATQSSSRRPTRWPTARMCASPTTKPSPPTEPPSPFPRSPHGVPHDHARQHPQPAQDLSPRPGNGRRAARDRPRHRPGRLRRAHGTVGLGQDHTAQPDRRPGFAHARRDHRRRPAHRCTRLGPAVALAQPARGLRVPVLQPDADAHSAEECRTAAAADEAVVVAAQAQCGNRARAGGPEGSRQASPVRALRRPAAARGDRARDRVRPHAADLRRTDGRSRPRLRRRDPDPAADAQPRARQDHCDGDARSEGRGVRDPYPASRQGHPGRAGRDRRLTHRGTATMKYLHLIWAALFRSKTRTFLTLFSVVTAFFLFGMLDSVRVAFNSGGEVSGANRMIASSRLSLTQMLPYSLDPQIRAIDGVKRSSYAAWFGGIYRDPKNFFPNFSVGPGYLDLYPEFSLSPDERKAWEADRRGAIVGETLAKKFGWKIGDTIPLQATIFPTKGSNDWQFTLRGIFRVANEKQKGQEQILLFHWNYFDEANDYVKGRVGWYILQLNDAGAADR